MIIGMQEEFGSNLRTKLVAGFILVLFSLVPVAMMSLNAKPTTPELAAVAWITCTLVSFLTGKFGVMLACQRVSVTSDGLTYTAPACRTVMIPWSEVQTIREQFGEGQFWTIKGLRGKVMIGETYRDWKRLVELINEHVEPRHRISKLR